MKKLLQLIEDYLIDENKIYNLREYINSIIKDDNGFDKKLVDIIYEIHEYDSYTTDNIEDIKLYKLKSYDEFKEYLRKIIKENINF